MAGSGSTGRGSTVCGKSHEQLSLAGEWAGVIPSAEGPAVLQCPNLGALSVFYYFLATGLLKFGASSEEKTENR